MYTDEHLDTQTAPHTRTTYAWRGAALNWSSPKQPQAPNNPVVVYVTDHAGTKTSTAGARVRSPSWPGKAGQPSSDTRWRKRTQRHPAATPPCRTCAVVSVVGGP